MRRRSIPLPADHKDQLRTLYLAYLIPSDQWAQRPRAFTRFVAEFNELAGRNDSEDDIRHYVITKRKTKQWVTFNGTHLPLRSPGDDALTQSEWEALQRVWLRLNKGRERYAFDGALRDQLADGFLEEVGRFIAGDLLYAAAMAKQKRGEWVYVTPEENRGMGFRDIDEVA